MQWLFAHAKLVWVVARVLLRFAYWYKSKDLEDLQILETSSIPAAQVMEIFHLSGKNQKALCNNKHKFLAKMFDPNYEQ